MPTADLTPAQVLAAATAARTIPQPARTAADGNTASIRIYRADAHEGPLSNKHVAEIDLGDAGPSALVALDDETVIPPAEYPIFRRVLLRLVVEARARKGAV